MKYVSLLKLPFNLYDAIPGPVNDLVVSYKLVFIVLVITFKYYGSFL